MFPTATICVFLFLPSLIWGAAVTNSSEDVSSQSSSNTRIVGGQAVNDRTKFAYQASLRHNSGHTCGASILDKQSVLTAAHCVVDSNGKILKASSFTVVVGDLYLSSTSITTVTRKVKYIFVHEKYNMKNYQNDIAVLKIDSLGTFTTHINSVALATSKIPDDTTCVVSGWGTLYEGYPYLSNELRYVEVPIIPLTSCNASYTGQVYPGMICAANTTKLYDSCQGDSGGPLVCNNAQAGIVSWGYGCARPMYPGVYTDVVYYRNWIKVQQARSSARTILINVYLISLSYIFISYF